MKERISYYSDGLKLSGILSTPDNSQGKRFPGVVLVPGFMSTADAFFPGFAEELNAAWLCIPDYGFQRIRRERRRPRRGNSIPTDL